MSGEDLFLRVECYVGLRRALGYVVRSEEKLLKDFVRFLQAQAVAGRIRAQMALDWAYAPSSGRGLSGQASRLKVVRRFLSHLQASIPETEIPPPGILGNVQRPKPYLYSPQQIEQLLAKASLLKPKGSLRSHTYTTMIGLIASTGLRVGEAIRLIDFPYGMYRYANVNSTVLESGDVYARAKMRSLEIEQSIGFILERSKDTSAIRGLPAGSGLDS